MPSMSIFKTRKKFRISERDPVYKVRYLGNVQTALMKGDGCVDKATAVLWNNFAKSGGTVGLDMDITVCTAGMKAVTSEQGLTEYRAHRISYCIAHPNYPRLFVWVYRHEGKRMKVELRCHAVLCKNEQKAKHMALSLHEKLTFSLNEFMRDKKRRQNSRLTLQKTNSLTSLPGNTNTYGTSLRSRMLSAGQKFKPSIEQSPTAPKLGTVTESFEEEQEEELLAREEEELARREEAEAEDTGIEVDESGEEVVDIYPRGNRQEDDDSINSQNGGTENSSEEGEDLGHSLAHRILELEIGNDIEALKRDPALLQDSDDNSSESGFSEQDTGNGSTGSSGNSSNASAGSNTAASCDIEDNDSNACFASVPNGHISESHLNECPEQCGLINGEECENGLLVTAEVHSGKVDDSTTKL